MRCALEYDAETLKTQDASERAAADSLAVTRQQYNSGAVSYLNLLDGAAGGRRSGSLDHLINDVEPLR